MKKLIVTMLAVLTCGATYALPVMNPADASLLCDGLFWEGSCCVEACDPCASWCDAISFRAGYYGDFVFNRNLRTKGGGDRRIGLARSVTNAGYLAANIWDRFDVFATLGASRFFAAADASLFITDFGGIGGARVSLLTRSEFSWSVGGRLTLWECGCTYLGIEGQYFQTCPKIRRITFAELASFYPDDLHFKYREWQVGLGISHRINIFVPYVAVKWSRAQIKTDHPTFLLTGPTVGSFLGELDDYRSQKHWGFAVGVSLIDCEKASLTAEGRWGDERAFHVNGQIRF